jgi:hypothetical protein
VSHAGGDEEEEGDDDGAEEEEEEEEEVEEVEEADDAENAVDWSDIKDVRIKRSWYSETVGNLAKTSILFAKSGACVSLTELCFTICVANVCI